MTGIFSCLFSSVHLSIFLQATNGQYSDANYLIFSNKEELRRDAVDALCCLAHALGEDFTIFIPSIHKLLVKHHLQVSTCLDLLMSLSS